MRLGCIRIRVMCLSMLAGSFAAAPPAHSVDVSDVASCDRFLVPKTEVSGKPIGQEACRMIELDTSLEGRKIRRMDLGISGTVSGYTIKQEKSPGWNFTPFPEFVFPQAGTDLPVFHGIGRYDMAKGSGMTVLYPAGRSAWNGKLFLTAHGGGMSFARGTLKVWDKNLDPADPLKDISKYERLMLAKGFAVAKTRRSTPLEGGDLTVTLDDGTVLRERNAAEQAPMIMSFALLAGNILKERMDRVPSRTYWYGHSGGARPGRMVNYAPGLNAGKNGKPVIDGIIVDDAAAGLWLPVVMKNGKDVLFTIPEERQSFVPMIELSHLLYVNETPDNPPAWRGSNNFLVNKRVNAKMLREKRLWNRYRYYEIAGISHSGGEYLPNGKNGDVEILDLSRLMDGIIDLLDIWVDQKIEPPPTMSDWRELGDADQDGIIENGAIKMPGIACPLGVYYILPPSLGPAGQGSTGFVPFDGKGLEPEDARGTFKAGAEDPNTFHSYVDMNHNGYRDFRETVTEAWQRLGLLKPNEKFSRRRYMACVEQAVSKLQGKKFFTAKVATFYREQAGAIPFPSQ